MPKWLLAPICLAALAASPAEAQTPPVTVYSRSIQEDDIAQRAKFDLLTTRRRPTRQDVISELADDMDKIKKAEKSGVDLADAQIDEAFADLCSRMRVAPEQLAKSLDGQGIRLDTLKQHIKADLARVGLARLQYHKLDDRHLYSAPVNEPLRPWRE